MIACAIRYDIVFTIQYLFLCVIGVLFPLDVWSIRAGLLWICRSGHREVYPVYRASAR